MEMSLLPAPRILQGKAATLGQVLLLKEVLKFNRTLLHQVISHLTLNLTFLAMQSHSSTHLPLMSGLQDYKKEHKSSAGPGSFHTSFLVPIRCEGDMYAYEKIRAYVNTAGSDTNRVSPPTSHDLNC